MGVLGASPLGNMLAEKEWQVFIEDKGFFSGNNLLHTVQDAAYIIGTNLDEYNSTGTNRVALYV